MKFRLDHLGWNFGALQELADSGVEVPALRDMPEVMTPYLWLWRAWHTLSSTRGRTEMGFPQRITVSALLAYVQYFEIQDSILRNLLFYVVQTLDALYVPAVFEHVSDEIKAARKK